MKTKREFDDKQFVEIIFSLWKNKLKIIILPIIFLTAAFVYTKYDTREHKKYVVYTFIKPLTYSQENKYIAFNKISEIISSYSNYSKNNRSFNPLVQMNFFELNKKNFFKLYVDTLNNLSIRDKIFKEILSENNLSQIEKNKLKNAIDELRSSLQIIHDDKKNKYNFDKTKIRFVINNINIDDENLKKILLILQKKINSEIQKILISRFDTYIISLEEIHNYMNKSINSNLIETREKKIEYLKNHAATARDLGIDKISENITEVLLTYDGVSNFIFNYEHAFYYLMGYEFLEKRIDRIKDELEKSNTNNQSYSSIDGIKELFNKTPLGNSEEFYAAFFDIENSKFNLTGRRLAGTKLMFFAFITGFLLSIIYFLIHESFIKKYISLIKVYKKR